MDLEEQYEKIYRYCYFRVGNAAVAEDLTQETFLRFFESSHYRDAGRPLAYLYTIARNLCVDEYRRNRELPLEGKEAGESPGCFLAHEGFEEKSVTYLALHAALAELSEEERELLLLRYANELSFAQLAQIYGRSRFALMRELKKITGELERRLSDERKTCRRDQTIL